MSNTLIDAFAQFGAKPKSRLRGRSAIAEDGALVLSCSTPHFRRPGPGVLRYEDVLSRDAGDRSAALGVAEALTMLNRPQESLGAYDALLARHGGDAGLFGRAASAAR